MPSHGLTIAAGSGSIGPRAFLQLADEAVAQTREMALLRLAEIEVAKQPPDADGNIAHQRLLDPAEPTHEPRGEPPGDAVRQREVETFVLRNCGNVRPDAHARLCLLCMVSKLMNHRSGRLRVVRAGMPRPGGRAGRRPKPGWNFPARNTARWPGTRACRGASRVCAFLRVRGGPLLPLRRRARRDRRPPPRKAFERLADLYRERFAETRRLTAEAAEGISDLQFTDAYRVPFQYRRIVREHLRAGVVPGVVRGRDAHRPRRQPFLRPRRFLRRERLRLRFLQAVHGTGLRTRPARWGRSSARTIPWWRTTSRGCGPFPGWTRCPFTCRAPRR